MALPTSTFTTYAAIGNREDLSDMIYRIDPTETPFVSGAEKAEATAINHEWQTQALASAVATNFQLEGDDVVADAATATVRLGNFCQISRKAPFVSGSQQAVEHAGRDDEMAYQEMLKGLELKRDVETYLLSNNSKVTGGATTARQTAAVLSWIKSNTSKGGGAGADPSAADGLGTRTAGTNRAFTEAQLKTVLSSIWTSGGKPNTIMTGAFNKQQFSTFTGRSSPIEEAASKKIVASVDAYTSDFGTLKVAANRFQRTSDALVLQMDMWGIAYLAGRKMVSFDLAKTGDNIRKTILSEFALEARNEKSSGGVFDLTSS
jgi:hypothetical protein